MIQRRGGRVSTVLEKDVHCSIVPRSQRKLSPSYTKPFRAARVFIVTDEWVERCVLAGTLLSLNEVREAVVYDPFMFSNVRFSTTQLPRFIKLNVIVAMQFYGAHYSPHLTSETNLLVFSRIISSHDAAVMPSAKLEVAQQKGVQLVTPSWVQQCIDAGRRLDVSLCDFSASPSPVSHSSSPVIDTQQNSGEGALFTAITPHQQQQRGRIGAENALQSIDINTMRKRVRVDA